MKKFIVTIWLLGGLATSGYTEATVISYSSEFSMEDNIQSDVAGSFHSSLSDFDLLTLPRFDGTLGTLQDVDISFTGFYFIDLFATAYDTVVESDYLVFPPMIINVRNDAGISATIESLLAITLTNPSSSSYTIHPASVHDDCYVHPTGDAAEAITGCGIRGDSSGTTNGSLSTALFDLTDFIGTDALSFSTQMSGSLSGDCDSDDAGDECHILNSLLKWDGDITVNYTYLAAGDDGGGGDPSTTVPEPTTLALLVIGLVGFTIRKAHA